MPRIDRTKSHPLDLSTSPLIPPRRRRKRGKAGDGEVDERVVNPSSGPRRSKASAILASAESQAMAAWGAEPLAERWERWKVAKATADGTRAELDRLRRRVAELELTVERLRVQVQDLGGEG